MPKHIILTDVAIDPADIIVVPRTAIPQVIRDLQAGAYTVRNTSAPVSGVVAAPGIIQAPLVTSPAAIVPATGLQIGSTATLSFGTAVGAPPPVGSLRLLRNGVDISSQVSGETFTFTQAGSYVLEVTWTNAHGTAQSVTSAVTVAEAPAGAVAPVITAQPSFSRSSATVGQTATLNFGTATGNPTPTRTWRLMRGAVDVTAQVSGGQIAFTQSGTYRLEVTWTNSAGVVQATAATIAVSAVVQWNVSGGMNDLTIATMPAPAALVASGGLNEITIGG